MASTKDSAAGMVEAMTVIARLASKLVDKEELGSGHGRRLLTHRTTR